MFVIALLLWVERIGGTIFRSVLLLLYVPEIFFKKVDLQISERCNIHTVHFLLDFTRSISYVLNSSFTPQDRFSYVLNSSFVPQDTPGPPAARTLHLNPPTHWGKIDKNLVMRRIRFPGADSSGYSSTSFFRDYK